MCDEDDEHNYVHSSYIMGPVLLLYKVTFGTRSTLYVTGGASRKRRRRLRARLCVGVRVA